MVVLLVERIQLVVVVEDDELVVTILLLQNVVLVHGIQVWHEAVHFKLLKKKKTHQKNLVFIFAVENLTFHRKNSL